ncbi:hypothetical protein GCM10010315_35840 [Streptomyces luteosporeus]|uniref:Uncharacterized protein n=1 Tax=Streptomyces luteosporeus TaxID=173856 RepID=A0ABN3TUQ6_9ACTN
MSPAMCTRAPATGPSPGHVIGHLVVGVVLARDLLPGDRVEEPVAAGGDHHDQIVPAAGIDGETDAEQPPDDRRGEHRIPAAWAAP